MSKRQETALNVYTLILLNLMFWICGHTPRSIINFNGVDSVASYIVRFLFFLVFVFFAVLAFAKDKTVFSEKVFDQNQPIAKRWMFGKWIMLILLQIGFDCSLLLLSSVGAQWNYIAMDIFIPLFWMILYFICTGKRHWKKENVRIFIFEFCFILCLTVVNVWLTDSVIAEYISLISKYQTDSPVLSAVKSNTEFLYGIKAALFDAVIGISLLVMNRVLAKDEAKAGTCNFTVFSLRMLLIGAVLFACVFLKGIYPDGVLLSFRKHTSDHTSYEYFDEVKESSAAWMIYRLSSKRKEMLCYQKDTVTLSIDGKASVALTRSYAEMRYVKDNELDKDYFLYPVLSEETEVYIYDGQIICFYENGVLHMITMDDIRFCEESKFLTQVCKKLLSQGNLYIFEYAAEYLERYAPDFIADYTERYANGDFTEAELLWMEINRYRDTYVTDIAKQY